MGADPIGGPAEGQGKGTWRLDGGAQTERTAAKSIEPNLHAGRHQPSHNGSAQSGQATKETSMSLLIARIFITGQANEGRRK
jgi:hypothetical protein